jgi:hypothetical protein
MSRVKSWLALGVLGVAFGGAAWGQEPPVPKPGSEHALLNHDVGVWDATIKTWDAPNAEPQESKGVETNTLQPGGLWLVSSFKGEFAGMDFAGNGVSGYDTTKKKYVGTWADSMTTSVLLTEGTYDESTKELTMFGETPGPDGSMMKIKTISKHNSGGTRTMAMHVKAGDSPEYFKMMEITYKKRAATTSTR